MLDLNDPVAEPLQVGGLRVPSKPDTPIDRAIWISLERSRDFCADNPGWELEGEDFQKAEDLARLAWFAPDDWLANLHELRPIVSGRTAPFPPQVLHRMKKIYRSFVFGNRMAVFAPARSLAEFCLRAHAQPLGISLLDANDRPRRFEILQDDSAETDPQLAKPMDVVRHYGNIVMHPSRDRDTEFPEPALRRVALDVIDALRLVVSDPYRPR